MTSTSRSSTRKYYDYKHSMMPFAAKLKIKSMKLLAATLLFFAGAAVMFTNDKFTLGGSLRRLQAKATSTLRRLAPEDYALVEENNYYDGMGSSYLDDTSTSTPEECSAACDATVGCVTFEHDIDSSDCYLFSDYDPDSIYSSDPDPYNIYVKRSYLDTIGRSDKIISILGDASAQGDPLFTGFRGQVLKFEGKDAAWYANVASPSLQWNLNFRKFDQCPEGEDMFVTSSSINLLKEDETATDSILVALDGTAPNQEGGLANGALSIIVGDETITTPGDYRFDDAGLRIVVHNTYGSCSRKWYDYDKTIEAASAEHKVVEGAAASPSHRRRLDTTEEEPSPLDFLAKSQGKMLDPEECDAWIKERAANGDLFDQHGGWATIYVVTPVVSFHLEVRQSDPETSPCTYQSLDTWISHMTKEFLAEEWRGIVGETRSLKMDEAGKPILHDRLAILDYPQDEAYEVDGPFATSFLAKDAASTSAVKIE